MLYETAFDYLGLRLYGDWFVGFKLTPRSLALGRGYSAMPPCDYRSRNASRDFHSGLVR